MNGIGFLLFCAAVLALALLGAYMHSKRLGWGPKVATYACPEDLPCDDCGLMIPKGDPIWVNGEGCAVHPVRCPEIRPW